MLRFVWPARLVICMLALLPAAVFAQSPHPNEPASTAPSQVALVDIVKVFEHHHRFKQQMETIKADIAAFERELQQQREAIASRGERLSRSLGEAERRQIEADLTRQSADLAMRAQLKRNEILEREAALYYETYQEVCSKVSKMARHYNISLVLRYDSSEMNPQQRGTVLKGVSRAVVFHRNLDLTDHLIHSVSSGVSQSSRPAANPPHVMQQSVSQRLPFSTNLSR